MSMSRMFLVPLAVLLCAMLTLSGCQTMGKITRRAPTTTRPAADAEPRKAGDPADEDAKGPQQTLYERLGGEKAIAALVDDLVARSASNPAVNFSRQGTPREWSPTPENIERLKARLIQFFGAATGGPQRYEGQDMVTAHRGMRITDTEFDAFASDLRASLDRLAVGEKEQKELMETIESARGAIAQPAK